MPKLCGVCQKDEAAHASTAHKFSPEGELLPHDPPPTIKSHMDFPLRLLLIQKGIITEQEIKGMEEALRESGAYLPRQSNH